MLGYPWGNLKVPILWSLPKKQLLHDILAQNLTAVLFILLLLLHITLALVYLTASPTVKINRSILYLGIFRRLLSLPGRSHQRVQNGGMRPQAKPCTVQFQTQIGFQEFRLLRMNRSEKCFKMRCILSKSYEGFKRYGNPDILFLGTLKNKFHILAFWMMLIHILKLFGFSGLPFIYFLSK